jgi:hypothetical protein
MIHVHAAAARSIKSAADPTCNQMLPWQQDKETGRQVPLYELPALFLKNKRNPLRVYLNAHRAWARKRKL